MSGLNVVGNSLKYKNILVVIKQTAFEEYSQVRRFRAWITTFAGHKSASNTVLWILFPPYLSAFVSLKSSSFGVRLQKHYVGNV